jgi:diguanylate cyclase (GGDEF)-like protein/PAS domain S-box-containing protein
VIVSADDSAPRAAGDAASDGLWRVAAEESEDAIIALDDKGHVVQWTAGASRLFGYRPDEILGQSSELLVPPELREEHRARVARVTAGERVLRLSFRGQHRSGMTVLLSLTMVPLPAGAGCCVVARDVSEREFAQATLAESEHRLREAQELSHVGLWVWDATGDVVQMSDELYRIHGIDPLDFDGTLSAYVDLADPTERAELTEALRSAIAGKEPFEREYQILRPDGTLAWLYSRATRELDESGQAIGLRGMSQDITERRRAADVMARQASMLDLLRAMAVAANEAETLEGALRACVHAVCSHAEWPVGHAVAVTAGKLEDDGIWHITEPRFEQLRDILRDERSGMGRLAQTVVATRRPIWLSDLDRDPDAVAGAAGAGLVTGFACPVFEQDQLVAVMEFYAGDRREPDPQLMEAAAHGGNQLGHVVERARAREALSRQALHDALTELPNRTLFLDRLRHALKVLDREPAHVAVMFIDLDNFKLINDSLGHAVGDRVLTTVSERLLHDMRSGDTTARFGGDEFMILCERLPSAEAAVDIAERLLEAVATPIDLGPDNVTVVNASAGIVITDDPGAKAEDLIRDADAAMYRAKEAGGSRYQIFDRALHQQAARKLTVANDLRRALVNDEFRLVYQPQVRLSDRKLIGVEALVRWQHPEHGLLPPSEFIAVAEQTQLIVPMGAWVLQEACRQLARWQEQPHAVPVKMCVNVSAVQLAQADLFDVVADTLRVTGIEPATLCIEITESVLMADADAGLEALLALKMLGVGIAVDDFGTGYSSLAYLSRFPIDVIKVDKGFVDPLGQGDGRAESIVQAVVDMSHALGVTTLAEGVETEEQLSDLIAIGCEAGQGYLFARPIPPEEISALLADSAQIVAPA